MICYQLGNTLRAYCAGHIAPNGTKSLAALLLLTGSRKVEPSLIDNDPIALEAIITGRESRLEMEKQHLAGETYASLTYATGEFTSIMLAARRFEQIDFNESVAALKEASRHA